VAALIPSVKLYVPLPTVVVVVEFGGSPAPIPHTLQFVWTKPVAHYD